MPDERFGEMVVGLVQPVDGTSLDAHELDDWCRTRMSGYKRPKRWVFVDSLERNAAGKANYKLLRALAQERV